MQARVQVDRRSERVALILSAAQYVKMTRLNAPNVDANEIHDRLADWRWTTVRVVDSTLRCTDVDGQLLKDAITQFIYLTKNASASLVYFSGHGLHYRPQNKHYILGKDYGRCLTDCTPIGISHELSTFAYSVEDLLHYIEDGCKINVCILDCCRTPVKGSANRWTDFKVPDETGKAYMICCAAGSDRPAHDALVEGSFSFFTDGIVKEVLSQPTKSVDAALKHAQNYIVEKYGQDWNPEIRTSMGLKFDNFYLAPPELRGRSRNDGDACNGSDVVKANAYGRPPPREVDVMAGRGLVHEIANLGLFNFKRGPCIIPNRLRQDHFTGRTFNLLMQIRQRCDEFLRTTENVTLDGLCTEMLSYQLLSELPSPPSVETPVVIPVEGLSTWLIFDERNPRKMSKVEQAMMQHINHQDIWTYSQFDKKEVSRWATYEGARITNPVNLFYGRWEGRGTVDELGVLLYPDNSEPFHVLVFHLKIDVRSVCQRVVAWHDHTNTVTLQLRVRKFQLVTDLAPRSI